MATSYRFSLEDVCWQQHLRDEGFVVLAGALLPEEVAVILNSQALADMTWANQP